MSQVNVKFRQLSKLLATLKKHSGDALVVNPYCDEMKRNNLKAYFEELIRWPFSGDLLVGEAPGWAGCALTGIPFTSEAVIQSRKHSFISKLYPRLKIAGRQREGSATIVWDFLSDNSTRPLPAFWNIFPFHPYQPGKPKSNRTPTTEEVRLGWGILINVVGILAPKRVFAIGRRAEEQMKARQDVNYGGYIRHPANGGKANFIAGMRKL